jgi:AmiR/NasT family two-component response regulator
MRVVIGEDQVLLREGLARLLAEYGFEVVSQVGDAEQLLRAVEKHRPRRRDLRCANAADLYRRRIAGCSGDP